MKKQLTIDLPATAYRSKEAVGRWQAGTATQTCDTRVFALRKFAVKGQWSIVKCSQAFTLVETLIAIAILLIAVVGPISLIGDSLHKLYYARDQMVAINLAQEGIEAVRKQRDTKMLGGVALDFFASTGTFYYKVDANVASPMLEVWGSSVPQPVYLNGGVYQQTAITAEQTMFNRIVTVTDAGGLPVGTERKVTSTVTWKTGGITGSISVSEDIFKWLQ